MTRVVRSTSGSAGRRRVLVAVVASLVLGACGSDVEPSGGAPIANVQLAERLEAGTGPLVLDVRTAEEYARGHIPGALNIPHDELPARVSELRVGKSDEIVVHCQSGRRAGLAGEALRQSGYSNVRELSGHWKEWEAAGLPIE